MTIIIQSIDFNPQILHIYKKIFTEFNHLADVDITQIAKGNYIGQWLGVYQENQLIGIATIAQITQNQAFVYNVGLIKEYRHLGYGSQLLSFIINKYGHLNLFLFVNLNNRPAIQLYRKFNFYYIDNKYKPPINELCYYRPGN